MSNRYTYTRTAKGWEVKDGEQGGKTIAVWGVF